MLLSFHVHCADFVRYARLFLRKTSAWHRINRLGYYSDIADLPEAARILQSDRVLPESSAAIQVNPAELIPPEGTLLEDSFNFADCSDGIITTLEEASSLLNLEEAMKLLQEW